jgi:hypothetical protein
MICLKLPGFVLRGACADTNSIELTKMRGKTADFAVMFVLPESVSH